MSTLKIQSFTHQSLQPFSSNISRCQSSAALVTSYPQSPSKALSVSHLTGVKDSNSLRSAHRSLYTMGFQPFFSQAKAYLPWSVVNNTDTNSRSSRSSSIAAAAARDRSASIVSTTPVPVKNEFISTA